MKLDLTAVMPLPEAVRSFDARTPVGTALRTAELDQLPLALRKRAFFSSAVESARFLELAKRELDKTIKQFGINRDRPTFILNMQELANNMGIRPTDGTRGTLEDIGSARRLALIYDTQVAMALGEAEWRSGQDPDILNAFPAQELLRIEDRNEERDWPQRWRDAGGQFYGDARMIALKTDPIWIAISRFDQPWPPFDFGSGMGVRDVRRRQAIALGLITARQRLDPIADQFDADIEAGLQGLSEPLAESLQAFFGKSVETTPDGKKLKLVKEQAPPLQHVVRIAADSRDESRRAALAGLDLIDQVHGIDDSVEPINIFDDIDEPFDFVEEIGRLILPPKKSKELKALDKAIAESKPLKGVVGSKDELRANAYAQFIAEESGGGDFLKTTFWNAPAFRTIRDAFITLFKALDWLR